MGIDILRFLTEHKVLPMSGAAWKECEICHFADVTEAQLYAHNRMLREEIGRKVGGVYVYYDQAGECVYVGKAEDLGKRFENKFQRTGKAGKNVSTEKPMGVSVAECDAMIAACSAAKVKLSVGYRLHFDP